MYTVHQENDAHGRESVACVCSLVWIDLPGSYGAIHYSNVTNHIQLDCLFNGLYNLTTRITSTSWRHHVLAITLVITDTLRWPHVNIMWSQMNGRSTVCLTTYADPHQRKIKVHVAGPLIGEFPAQMVSNAEKSSIWCRHHILFWCGLVPEGLSTVKMVLI